MNHYLSYLPILPPVIFDHYRQAHVGRKEKERKGDSREERGGFK